jgi:multidrug efflux pump
MTLLAVVLAVGLVVDDAIVVLENISRHLENGMTKMEAALQGGGEISMAIVAMTLTLVSVYAPFAFVEGTIGQLFIEFAVALTGSVLISGFIALTLSPLMCSVLLTRKDANEKFFPQFDVMFHNFTEKYHVFLEQMYHRKFLTPGVALASLVASGIFLLILPRETAPKEDRGMIMAHLSRVGGKNIDYYEEQLAKVLESFGMVSEFEHCVAVANPNNGFIFAPLIHKTERKRSASDIAFDLFGKVQYLHSTPKRFVTENLEKVNTFKKTST